MPKIKQREVDPGERAVEDINWDADVQPSDLEGMPHQHLTRVNIDDLTPHPNNPNHGDVDVIRESIRVNGWYGVITVQREGMRILAGEHRWRAAKAEGVRFVDVAIRDVDDVEALRIMLVDNESARHATIDEAVQRTLLESLASLDPEEGLAGTGHTLDSLMADAEAAEAAAQAEAEAEVGGGDFEPGEYDPEGVGARYGLLLVCEDEADQKQLFERAVTEGWRDAKQIRVVAI